MKSMSFSDMLKTDLITKKMNEAIAQMTFASDGLRSAESDIPDKKMESIVVLVKSIRLQSPSNHTGLVVAFSSLTNEVPFPIDAGITFAWYRVKDDKKSMIVTPERICSSFYLPTLDDVGFSIGAQFEDEFEQGQSRHLESDVITIDPMMRTVAESILADKFYKISDTSISFGNHEFQEKNVRNRSNSTQSRQSCGMLIMDGLSSIEVDTGGFYLLLPVSTEILSMDSNPLGMEDLDRQETRSSRYLKKGAKLFTLKKDRKQNVNESRMTLFIPASDNITVRCTQLTSLVITIPLLRAPAPYSSSKSRDRENGESNAETNNMDSSSKSSIPDNSGIPIAPWTYIQSHDERAVDVTADDEVEASEFARALSSLERYIGALPSSAVDVSISITCCDRIQRDTLVVAIRLLAAQQISATIEMRKKSLPWINSEISSLEGLDSMMDPGSTDCVDSLISRTTADSSSVEIVTEEMTPDMMIEQAHKRLSDANAKYLKKEAIFEKLKAHMTVENKKLTEENEKMSSECEKVVKREKKFEELLNTKNEELISSEEICKHKEALLEETEESLTEMTAVAESLKTELSETAESLKESEIAVRAAEEEKKKMTEEWKKKEEVLLQQIELLTSAKSSEDLIINELKELLLKSTEKEKETKISLDKTLIEIEELRVTSESQEGEINRLKRCTDSQSRDLKRAIREKDNIAKSLQESVAAAAAAAASASASASRARTSRTNSPLQDATKKKTTEGAWENLIHVPTFATSTSTISPAPSKSSAIMPDITAYIRGSLPGSSSISPREGKGKTDSDKIEKNPFGDDSETVHNGAEGEGRFRDGNYSDCDNESDDEEDSDNEQNSSAGSPSVRVKKSIVDTAFDKKDDGDDSSDSEELTFKKR